LHLEEIVVADQVGFDLAGRLTEFVRIQSDRRGVGSLTRFSDSRLIENRSGCVVKVQLARLAVRSDSKLAAILALVFGGGRAFN
jgi:ferredoxin-fold anticodon binding domain-containing protein